MRVAAILLLLLWSTGRAFAGERSVIPAVHELNTGWRLQSGCTTKATGDQISTGAFHEDGWIDALVPGTVLGSQVEAGIFKDPFFGMNLRNIPGADYPAGKIFGYLPMSTDSPYHCSWWYRVKFQSHNSPGTYSSLRFNGINYRANIWLNGKKIASSEQIAGAFRSHDLDVTDSISRQGNNILAVEVFAQTEDDLGLDFLDWNPAPADKNLGLWRNVFLVTTGPVTVKHPSVVTHFTSDDLKLARIEINADITNQTSHALKANVVAELSGKVLQQSVVLAPHELKAVHFDPDKFPHLLWKDPPIWWPYQYGDPDLEKLDVTVKLEGRISDHASARIGIREIESSLNESGYREFRINRRPILIRGAGWTPDMFYREPKEKLRQELTYVRQMNLNTIRLEGKLGSETMFDLADEMGILVMAGWQCCDYWQKWDKWTPKDLEVAAASEYSQISRLRSHPSLLVWLNGSDESPPPLVEEKFLSVLQERNWPNPILSSAADRTSTISGKSGVKMSGPYDYVPPEYWYLDKERLGGAFGFNTETGPGPAIPLASTIQRTLPKDKWWPINEEWNYHAGLGKFAQYNNFNTAMSASYGAANGLDDYLLKAQLMAYDGERAMFEAYAANKYRATGVIQWMLNNAWPSFIWHLYDYNLVPGGGYFGTKKANEPLHVQYRYDDREIVVVNSTLQSYGGLHAEMSLYNLNGVQLSTDKRMLEIGADAVVRVESIPQQTATTFLKLELQDRTGSVVSENFYWIPAELAKLDWDKSTYVTTPAIHYADMRDLGALPQASVHVSVRRPRRGEDILELENTGTSIAFFLQLRAVKVGTEEDVTPLDWDDNYVSLVPGERRKLLVRGIGNTPVDFMLSGWNLAQRVIKAEASLP